MARNVWLLVLVLMAAGGTTISAILVNRIDGGLNDAITDWRTWACVGITAGSVVAGGFIAFRPAGTQVGGVSHGLRVLESVAPPPLLTAAFVGRDMDLAWLRRMAGRRQAVAVIHGLGGAGKSSLVAKFLLGRRRKKRPVWWITADTPTAIEQNLARCAQGLNLGRVDADPAALARAALTWLVERQDSILVLDNVEDIAHITEILQAVSAARGPGVIVTTRLASGWSGVGAECRALGVLRADEAVEALTKRARPGRGRDWSGALELVAELGYLPLAVDQVGAYLNEAPGVSPQDFLGELQVRPETAMDRATFASASARTMARIWRVTLDRLARTNPEALDVLRILAWWSPEDIPASLLDEVPGADDALQALAGLSMISRRSTTIQIHRLVQLVARTPDERDPHRRHDDISAARERAASLLYDAVPSNPRDPTGLPTWLKLAPCVESIASFGAPQNESAAESHLLNQSAMLALWQGNVKIAITWLEHCVDAGDRIPGIENAEVWTFQNNLALAHRYAGDTNRAIDLLQRTLAEAGPELITYPPLALGIRVNLAGAYQMSGDLKSAINLYEHTLAEVAPLFGPDAPETLALLNNLGSAYEQAGDLDHAISLHEKTLASREKILGVDAPDVLISRSNLANAYWAAGDIERAIPLYERTLADCDRVFGPDLPEPLMLRNNLANAYLAAGDPTNAIALLEWTVREAERITGTDAPDVLLSRNNLASAYSATGDVGLAARLYEITLADCERVLGTGHPTTLLVRNNLAGAYRAAGDHDRAIVLYEQAIKDGEISLSTGHPMLQTLHDQLQGARRARDGLSVNGDR